MKKIIIFTLSILSIHLYALSDNGETKLCLFSNAFYQKNVLKKVGMTLPDLMTYPSYRYPNDGYQDVENYFKNGKILIFGYGSLMNKVSAGKSLKPDALNTMETAIAFGVKRVFDYKASKVSHWSKELEKNEKAMLNLVPTFNIATFTNGVTMEVDAEDFSRLVSREVGYDLVPILVVNEKKISEDDASLDVKVAYTFIAMNELRDHINYTSTKYYPVRGYLKAVREAAATHGEEFLALWNQTTYMADGITNINEWDQKTFEGILCTSEPKDELCQRQ